MAALREGSFDQAGERARTQLDKDPANPYAHLVRAVVRYKKAMHQFSIDARTVVVGAVAAGGLNPRYVRTTLDEAEGELAAVEVDLAGAATDPALAVELCLACWEIDWNGNGRIDEGDRKLFQIEHDEAGRPIPPDDPRRKPTFRFDAGDIAWARAFVSFQRAALDVLLAYDFADVAVVLGDRHARRDRLVLRLTQPDRIARARALILDGLTFSDDARLAYLSETDDDREWVPNPRQRSHPLPLPVDQALYDTWQGVLVDVRRLVQGEEGLGAAELLAATEGHVTRPPRGYIDLGAMLAHPKDLVIDVHALEELDRERDVEGALHALLGQYYVAKMKASPLPRRLLRMKGEVDRSEEDLEHKLRYLFWLN